MVIFVMNMWGGDKVHKLRHLILSNFEFYQQTLPVIPDHTHECVVMSTSHRINIPDLQV